MPELNSPFERNKTVNYDWHVRKTLLWPPYLHVKMWTVECGRKMAGGGKEKERERKKD